MVALSGRKEVLTGDGIMVKRFQILVVYTICFRFLFFAIEKSKIITEYSGDLNVTDLPYVHSQCGADTLFKLFCRCYQPICVTISNDFS